MGQTIRRDIVVIGASSGGLEVLMTIASRLPEDLPAAIFVVVHVPSQAASHLPEILSRAGPLPAAHATDHEKIESGRIYVAPPDFHLLLEDGQVRVLRGPRENNHRPAIDPLFRTAAQVYGPRAIGIVLSGGLDDGTAGLFAIKSRGGIAIVQDPNDALFPDMPRNALAANRVDYCASKEDVAKLIVSLTSVDKVIEPGAAMDKDEKLEKETNVVAMKNPSTEDGDKLGTPSVYGCPECGGTLWELEDGEWLRFRCRVGHAYSADGLLRSQSEALDSALWNAARALEENAALARRLADRARENKHLPVAEKYEQRSRQAQEQAEMIKNLLLTGISRQEERD